MTDEKNGKNSNVANDQNPESNGYSQQSVTITTTPESTSFSEENTSAAALQQAKARADLESRIQVEKNKQGSKGPAADGEAVVDRSQKKVDSSVAPKTPISAPPSKTKVSARLSILAKLTLFFCMLLSLASVGAVAYLYFLQQDAHIAEIKERHALTEEGDARADQLSQLHSELGVVAEQIKQDRSAIGKAGKNRELLQSRMAALESDIAKITGSHRIDWMLREVEHFVNVAEQRLSLLGDARGALALMTEADNIARAMQEPAARSLREALIKDIHSLKQAAETSLDVDGIFIRISELNERIEKLGIPTFELYQDTPEESDLGEPIAADGVELFTQRFLYFMQSLVRYQKHEKSKPIILSAERDYLKESIILLLQQAQLALLRGDNGAYHLSLQGALERVDLYVSQQTKETRFFMTEIRDLDTIQLTSAVPSLEQSARAVRVFRDFWDKEKYAREQAAQFLEQENNQ